MNWHSGGRSSNMRSRFAQAVPFADGDSPIAERNLCNICFATECNRAFSPCGHMACIRCASMLTKCPICRAPVSLLVRVNP